MRQRWKGKRQDKEFYIFVVFLVGMAVYYGYRMFEITPWYDELYTYYYFISKGPVYAAIHWPLPNNHVGYSALSACLIIFGNAAVALRGVSWICSLGSLILLYRIGRKCFAGNLAFVPMFIFAGMSMVNQLAVQGRGYALVTFCYLVALWELFHIVVEHRHRKKDHLLFGMSLVIALWAIPSSLYVVMPVCLIGGVVLLVQKKYKMLGHLILTSLVSAVCTAGLYGILWLAIGSNLLIKSPESGFEGMSHVTVILHEPVRALITGVSYMLDTPYIQSMTREQFSGEAFYWLKTLFGTQLSPVIGVRGNGMCFLIGIALVTVILWMLWRIKVKEHPLLNKENETEQIGNGSCQEFLEWYFLLTIFLLAVALILQCKLPYQRVFSFLGVWIALLLAWLLGVIEHLVNAWLVKKRIGKEQGSRVEEQSKIGKRIGTVCSVLVGGLCILTLLLDTSPYSMRDELMQDAFEQLSMEQLSRVAVTDCDQEYFLLYAYGMGSDRVTRQIEEADAVLIDKALLDMEYGYRENPEEWKFYLTAEQIPTAYLEEEMEPIYENWHFVLYEKK